MSGRSSEIDRTKMGGRVTELAENGDTAPMIAATISQESGHEISKHMVHRYLQKANVHAAVVPSGSLSGERNALEMLAAAISGLPETRDAADAGITYFGRYKLDTSNPFERYYAIAREISGQVERGFVNIALKVTNGAKLVGAESDSEKIDALAKDLDFSSLLQDVVRSTCEMGNCVVLTKSSTGESIVPELAPMSYITLLTDQQTPGTVDDKLVHGKVTQVIHNELDSSSQILYERGDVGLFRLWAGANKFTDIAGRPTFSIYGRSMTIGVETPLKSLLTSSYYYDEFIKRYGIGRLHVNMTLLADMLRDQTITAAAAQQTQEEDTAALQQIGPNEDIVSAGRDISMLESKQGFDIMPYLEWRRKQIDRVLLQSDIGAGDVGSSWTSAGIAVSAQDYDTYKSLRETLFGVFFDDIVTPRLPEFNLSPKSISITATPFLRVDVPYRDLIEMHDRGIIMESELRDRAGFPVIKPDEA